MWRRGVGAGRRRLGSRAPGFGFGPGPTKVLVVTSTRGRALGRRHRGDPGRRHERWLHGHRTEPCRRRRASSRPRTSSSTARWSSSTPPATCSPPPSRTAFEEYFHDGGGFLGIGSAIETEPDWQFLTDVLGTRAIGQDRRPVRHDQGRRPRPRRVEGPARVLEPDATPGTTSPPTSAALSHVLATCRWSTTGAFELAAVGRRSTASPAARWAPTIRSPGARTTGAAARSTPRSATRRPASARPTSAAISAGAIKWAAGRGRPGLQRLRRDRAGQLPADQDQRRRRTSASRSASTCCPTGASSRPTAAAASGCTTRRRNATTLLAADPGLHDQRGRHVRPGDRQRLRHQQVGLPVLLAADGQGRQAVGRLRSSRRRRRPDAAPNTGASLRGRGIPYVGYFQLSRFKFVDAHGDDARAPGPGDRAGDPARAQQPRRLLPRRRRHRLRLRTTTCGWSPVTTRRPAAATPAASGRSTTMITAAGLFNAPHVDARRGALNTNDLRGKVLRIKVKDGDIAPAEANAIGGAYTVPAGQPVRAGHRQDAARGLRDGLPEPVPDPGRRERRRVRDRLLARLQHADGRPRSRGHRPRGDRPQAGQLRLAGLLPDGPRVLPLELQHHHAARRPGAEARVLGPEPGPGQRLALERRRRPVGRARPARHAADHQPRRLVLVHAREPAAQPPLGTPCSAYYDGTLPVEQRVCPRLFPELGTGGVGPHGAAKYKYDPDNPDTTKFPPYYDGAVFFGEFTRDTLREIRLDSQNRVFKINNLLNCGALGSGARRAVRVRVRQPDGHAVRRERPLLPAHLR